MRAKRTRGTAELRRVAEIQQALFDYAHGRAALELNRADARFLVELLEQAMAGHDVRTRLYVAVDGRPPPRGAEWIALDCAVRRHESPRQLVKALHADVAKRWRVPVARVKDYERKFRENSSALLAAIEPAKLRPVIERHRMARG